MTDRIGQQLGNYRLIRLLGTGGYADVYLGEHIHLKRKSAIKILHTILTDEQKASFLIEAQRLADLAHPSIIEVFDFAIEGDLPYLIMEYAPNGTLRNRYPKGSCLELSTVVSYVKYVAEPLQYVHDQNLVHRDVKPENLLVGKNQEILLSDLGIAAIAHQTNALAMQGLAGTPTYMAPEQSQGMSRAASDQYALGVVAYEWLCGTPPFQGTVMALGVQHRTTPPPSLCQRMPTIPPAVEEVIFKALAKKPQHRFRTITEFAEALEVVSETTQTVAAVSSPIRRSKFPSSLPNAPKVLLAEPIQNEEAVSREDISLRFTQPLPLLPQHADWASHPITENNDISHPGAARNTPLGSPSKKTGSLPAIKTATLWKRKRLLDLLKAMPVIVLALGIVITGFVTYLTSHAKAPSPHSHPTTIAQPTPLAEDTFRRPNQDQWGTASDGHNQWTVDTNTQQFFSVTNDAGMITGGLGAFDALIGPSTPNVDVTVIATVNHFGSMDQAGDPVNFGIMLRWQDPNHWYKAYIDGSQLYLVKWVDGQITILDHKTVETGEGVPQQLRFGSYGTSLVAKVWPINKSEPADWMVSANDSTFTTGQFGIRVVEQPKTVISLTSFSAEIGTRDMDT